MKTKTAVSIWGIASLLSGFTGVTDVLAREVQLIQPDARAESAAKVSPGIIFAERLGSGVAADVYRVSCVAECIRADVNDIGPYDDTRFKVTINGSSPAFTGNGSAFNPSGGLSNPVEVCSGQHANILRRAYVIYTEVNATGAENYDTEITCRRAGGGFVVPTIQKILDQ